MTALQLSCPKQIAKFPIIKPFSHHHSFRNTQQLVHLGFPSRQKSRFRLVSDLHSTDLLSLACTNSTAARIKINKFLMGKTKTRITAVIGTISPKLDERHILISIFEF